MRTLKTISTQSHIIHIVKSNLANEKLTCLNEDGSKLSLSNELSVFIAEGSENVFIQDEADEWILKGSVTGPVWSVAQPNIFPGGVATSNTEICLVFIPKETASIENTPGPDHFKEIDIMSMDRESFVDIGEIAIDRQVNPDTFEESDATIDDKISDDIIFE
jgi:hypothetical protein